MALPLRLRRLAAVVATLTIAAAALMPSSARACSCTNFPEFAEAYTASHTVFVGEVLGILPVDDVPWEVRVLLSVEGWWKGAPPNTTIEIRTGADDGVCGVNFEVGQEWIVFALQTGPPEARYLWTHSCWRSHQPYVGDPDLDALGPVPARGTSWGSLKISYR